MSEQGSAPAAVPALGISLSVQLGDKRSLVLQTHVAGDARQAEVTGLLMKLANSSDVLELRYKVQELRDHFKRTSEQYRYMLQDMERINQQHQAAWDAQNRRGQFKLEGKDKADRNNAEATVKRFEQELKNTQKDIDAAQARLDELGKDG